MDERSVMNLKSSDSVNQELLYKDLTPNGEGPVVYHSDRFHFGVFFLLDHDKNAVLNILNKGLKILYKGCQNQNSLLYLNKLG